MRPGPVLLTLAVPVSRACFEAALEGLTAINAAILSERSLPDVYDSGVRYRREGAGRERWQNCGETLALGYGDCEDLASWRAAWLRVHQAEPARCVVIQGGPSTFHVVVQRGDGTIEDPSEALGMR